MRVFRHWKMIVGLTALFGAGCFTGAVGLLIVAFTHPSPDSLNHYVNQTLKGYERRLRLTPEQKVKLKPVMQKTREQIRAVARNGIEQSVPILEDANRQIDAELTSTQRAEFDQIKREMLQRLRDFQKKQAPPPPSAQPSQIPSIPPPQ